MVAQIEGRYEKFEAPLLENLMDYWECIVQLHQSGHEQDDTLLQKADEKLSESISQSYVYMIGEQDALVFSPTGFSLQSWRL